MKQILMTFLICIVFLPGFGQNYVTQYNGSGYVTCGSSVSNSVSAANKVTVETRFRMTTTPGSWDSPCGTYHSNSWTDGGFGLYYNGSTQKMNFYIYDYSTNNATASFDPTNTSWHHLAGTWEQSTGLILIYLDGALAGTDNYTGTIGPITSDIFQIGAANSLYNWKGQLDEVRVWNVVRSQADIQANMNTQLTGSESGLIAYYKMEEGSGTSLTDNSGHSNTGTMTAGVTWIGAPTISSFTPTSAGTGIPVTINGSLFTGATAVTFGGTAATSMTVISDSEISAVVGSGASGDVVVNAPGGAASRSGFTYILPYPTTPTSISVSANPICNGYSTMLTANGAVGTVYWYIGSCGGTQVTTGNTRIAVPTTTTTYYARNYNNSQFSPGCASATVTVNQPSYSPTPKTVADLQATGTGVKWYAASSGGSPLSGSSTIVGGNHYYASQTINGNESSDRTDVIANFDPTPCKPSGSAAQSYTTGSTVASLQAAGSNIRWYAFSGGGSVLDPATELQNGVHYWASQTVDCTESATRFEVTVTLTGGPQ